MVKIASRDILDVLRFYKLAGDDNVPRNVETVKLIHNELMSTLVSFRFNRQQMYILFDSVVDNDTDSIINQIRSKANRHNINGHVVKNPSDDTTTYAMPFRGKECYLFIVISDKKRLDSELASRYPENSRSTWQKYIKSGCISVNGVVVTSSKCDITDVDSIAITLPQMPDYSKNELPIIYIDDNVIVINKPSGVLSHAKGAINDEFTVAEFFRRYTTYNIDSNRPGIIHRLDRDTSGIMMGARNAETAVLLQKQFADRKVKKDYVAILDGIPKLSKANIDLPIGRNPSAPSTFRVDANGKSAITKYEVLASDDKYSLVKLSPKTGRTHQLRVHMKYIGTPIRGDKVYGKPSKRLYLHAMNLEITIPNGNRQIFYAPIPTEILDFFPNIKI